MLLVAAERVSAEHALVLVLPVRRHVARVLDLVVADPGADHGPDHRVVVVDFTVNHDAMVWPMVGPGVSNDEIQYARDMAPDWEHED